MDPCILPLGNPKPSGPPEGPRVELAIAVAGASDGEIVGFGGGERECGSGRKRREGDGFKNGGKKRCWMVG